MTIVVVLFALQSMWAQNEAFTTNYFSSLLVDTEVTSIAFPRADMSTFTTSLRFPAISSDSLYNSLPYSYYYENYQKGSTLKTAGMVVTFVGLGLVVTGSILGLRKNAIDNTAGFAGGVLMFTIGTISVLVGVPLWIAGGSKRKKNRKAMEKGWPQHTNNSKTLSVAMTNNGAGLVWNF